MQLTGLNKRGMGLKLIVILVIVIILTITFTKVPVTNSFFTYQSDEYRIEIEQ